MEDMRLIDTHTHLCDPVFDADRIDVVQRARQAGVVKIIALGETMDDAEKNLRLADEFEEILPGAGLYPTCLDLAQAESMVAFIRTHQRRLTAIGEVGLDFRVVEDESAREIQKQIFSMFIDLSKELDLPLNVHSRSAGRHAVAMLLAQGAEKVQLHAFDGKYGNAIPAVEAGYFFSVPPSVVRSRQKQKLVKNLPLSCLLVETDSPVLGPDPGIRNEPENIRIGIDMIARIKQVDPEEVAERVRDNSFRLYGASLK